MECKQIHSKEYMCTCVCECVCLDAQRCIGEWESI